MERENQRRAERKSLTVDVGLRKPKELSYDVVLRNLSPHGCCVSLRERLQPGQLIWIGIPGLENLQSKVRWNCEWYAGVEFERPMHRAVFEHVASRLEDDSTLH